MEEIDLVSGEMKLEGFISLDGALSKVKLIFFFGHSRADRSHFTGIPVFLYEFSIKAAIVLLSKRYFLVDVNRHPISLGELHRIIDSSFSASSFAKNVSRMPLLGIPIL